MRRTEPTVEPTDLDKAYAAGFVDGEGSFGIYVGGSGRKYHYAQLAVGQNTAEVLRWMQERWGGSLKLLSPIYNGRPRDHWRLGLRNRQAVQMANDILPRLIVKRANAENLIAFGELKRYPGSAPGGPGNYRIPEDELAKRRELAEISHQLNQTEVK